MSEVAKDKRNNFLYNSSTRPQIVAICLSNGQLQNLYAGYDSSAELSYITTRAVKAYQIKDANMPVLSDQYSLVRTANLRVTNVDLCELGSQNLTPFHIDVQVKAADPEYEDFDFIIGNDLFDLMKARIN